MTGSQQQLINPDFIDARELAKRLSVKESWVRERTRKRTPQSERIPCFFFGRWVRFAWNSPELTAWLRHRMINVDVRRGRE